MSEVLLLSSATDSFAGVEFLKKTDIVAFYA